MLVPMVMLVALVKRHIWQDLSKIGMFVGKPFMSAFLAIFHDLEMEIQKNHLWII